MVNPLVAHQTICLWPLNTGPRTGRTRQPSAHSLSKVQAKRESHWLTGGRNTADLTFSRTFRLTDDDREPISLPLLNNARTLRWVLPVCCRYETAAREVNACRPVDACHFSVP
ncbi:hypothetical protein MRX96_027012 [Rhipicephalus microplus]